MPALSPLPEDSRQLAGVAEEARPLSALAEVARTLAALAEISGAIIPALPALFPAARMFPSSRTFPSDGTAAHAPVGVPALSPVSEGSRILTPLSEV